MKNFETRIRKLEAGSQAEIIHNVYHFQPKDKTVYRKHGKEKIWMDFEELVNAEYEIFETIFAAPNYDNPNWEEEKDGEWLVCVGSPTVINENS